jgi:hypothetical protein
VVAAESPQMKWFSFSSSSSRDQHPRRVELSRERSGHVRPRPTKGSLVHQTDGNVGNGKRVVVWKSSLVVLRQEGADNLRYKIDRLGSIMLVLALYIRHEDHMANER